MGVPGKVQLVAVCALAAGKTAARARDAAPDVSFPEGDRTLLIRTDRYEVRWRDGCLVGLNSLLPAPVDLIAGGPPAAYDVPGGIGDGLNWFVRVNGREVGRRFRESSDGGWHDERVTLKEYAG